MSGAVSLALAADEPASRRVADALFPEAEHRFLTRDELRPPAPFSGPLFELLAAFARAPGGPPHGFRPASASRNAFRRLHSSSWAERSWRVSR